MRYPASVRRWIIVLGLLSLSATTHAQRATPETDDPAEGAPADGEGEATPEGQPENMEATRQARQHFTDGMGHFDERRFREAIREFQLAGQLVPSADLWFNIARAHEELSEYEPAIEYYQRYLRDRVDPPDRERVEAHIASLQERLEAERRERRHAPTTGTLRIRTSIEGAAVAVDGRSLGESPIAAPMTLPPGRHRLTVHEDGYVPFESEVRVEAGVTTAAYAELEPATDYRAVRGGRIFTWIAGGLAAVALGTSVYFGARAAGQQSDGNFDGAEGLARKSDFALGAAITLGVGAVVLWFLEGSAVETERVRGPE